jgi:hypothetical protein
MLTTLPVFAEYVAQAQVSMRAAKAKARSAKGGVRKEDVQTQTKKIAMQTVLEEDEEYVIV